MRKNYTYIDKVLSHIRGKKNKEFVSFELFDHIDERNKYYIDLGYDEESAYEKAEYVMGDGDILGEQLDLQMKRSRKSSLMLVFLDVIPLAITDIAFCIDFLTSYEFYTFELPTIVFSLIVLTLGFVSLIIATKNKRVPSAITGTLCSISPAISLSKMLGDVLSAVIKGEPFALGFYRGFFNNGSIGKIISAFVLAVIFTAFFNCLIVYIKTKRLENTKYDIKKCNVISALLTAAIVIAISLSGAVCISMISYRDKAYDYTAELSERLAHSLVDNIDSLMTDDKDLYYYAIQTTFEPSECNCDRVYNESFDFDNYYPATAEYADIYSESVITIHQPFFNPLAFRNGSLTVDYRHILTADEVFKAMTPADAPLPADIYFSYTRDKCTLQFNYSGSRSYILFTYDFSEERFELTDSSVLEYDRSVSLSEKQKKLLENAIRDKYISDISDNRQLVTELYDVSASDKCNADNVYKINLGCCAYSTAYDNGKLKIAERELENAVSIIARLEEDEALIISIDYLSSENDIIASFTDTGYKNYQSRDNEWYKKAIQ